MKRDADTGIRFAQAGYAVFGMDVEGHGKSDGLQAYIPSFNDIVDDCIAYFKSIRGLKISLQDPHQFQSFSFSFWRGGLIFPILYALEWTVIMHPMRRDPFFLDSDHL
jgi:alpha-beta hydrolase superfamily lysophospholipase